MVLFFTVILDSRLTRFTPAIVEQVRDGTTLRVRLLMPDAEHQIINIALAGVRSARASTKQGESSEPWGEEVGLAAVSSCTSIISSSIHVCLCRPNSLLSPACFNAPCAFRYFHCPPQLRHHFKLVQILQHLLLLVSSSVPVNAFYTPSLNVLTAFGPVLHPAGNVAEHLVASGLARIVDWHAGMLANNGGMERLRAAERSAKEKRLCLYANTPTATATAKANGTTSTGQTKSFDAIVVRIWSGDQISVVEKESGKERRLQLSSTRGPKYLI